MAQATVTAQARMRAGSMWTPAPPTMMHTRPLRSSPLAGPAFSTLPTIISESSEESHGEPRGKTSHELDHTRSQSSSSVVSQAASGSGCGTGYGSGHGSMVVEAEGSTSSISLPASANGTTSSQGHGNSLNAKAPARLSKSLGGKGLFGRATPSEPPRDERSESPSLAAPPRARTTSGHSRSASLPTQGVLSPPQHSLIPQVYSRTSSRATSPSSSTTHLSVKSNSTEAQNAIAKQPPSISRDPSSNWMSSSPFGPATTPKFSRLALASPAVVLPLSAKEYRKKKAKESNGKEKEKDLPNPPTHVAFAKTLIPRPSPAQGQSTSAPSKVPEVALTSASPPQVSPPPSGMNQLRPGHDPDPAPRSIPPPPSQPASPPVFPVTQSASLTQSTLSVQPRPLSPKKPRSRPTTPPRSSLAAHPISPKASTNTFFSFASSDDDEAAFPSQDPQTSVPDPLSSAPSTAAPDLSGLPPARPRPRPRRRKSFPERLSSDAIRLSLLEAVDQHSQEGFPNPLSPKNSTNRLSTMSQASGNTLFYDFSESERDKPKQEAEQDHVGTGDTQNPRVSVLHTQSLEDLSSTLARTGIEVAERGLEDDIGDEDRQKVKGKRNVRTVRISDTVEVSPPPVPRRRKLTKTRPAPQPPKEQKPPKPERRTSLLRWRSKSSEEGKAAVVITVDMEKSQEDGHVLSLTKGLGPPSVTTASSPPPAVEDVPPRPECRSAVNGSPTKGMIAGTTMPTPKDRSIPSTPPRRGRRSTFQFISAPSFHLPKREKSKTEPIPVPSSADTGKKGKKGSESGYSTDTTVISTVTQGSQTTLTPISNSSAHSSALIDLTIVTPPRQVPRKEVPDLQTLISQERAKMLPVVTPSQSKGASTPSLTTSGSTATSSSVPGSPPSVVRLNRGSLLPRPSTLKESFTDTSEDDSVGITGAKIYGPYTSLHRCDQNVLLTATETSEDDEKLHRHTTSQPSSRPGTGSSTLTIATTASYVSFSTVPASTSSPSSSSASLFPSLTEELVPVEKPSGDVHLPVHTDVRHCAHCGHLIAEATSAIHGQERDRRTPPMFSIPLVTMSPPVAPRTNLVATHAPRSGSTPSNSRPHSPSTFRALNTVAGGKGLSQTQLPVMIVSTPAAAWEQQASTRKNDKHISVPVPASSPVPTKLNPSTPPRAVLTKGRPNVASPAHTPTLVPEDPPELNIAITSATSTQARRHRSQTAPAGSGDAALRFIEAARLQQASTFAEDGFAPKLEPSVTGTKIEGVVKNAGGGESKLKSVIKGWLKKS